MRHSNQKMWPMELNFDPSVMQTTVTPSGRSVFSNQQI